MASSIYILYANILQPPNVLAIPPWISAEGVAGKQSINICVLCIMNERMETWVMAAGISYTCLQALNICMRLFVYLCTLYEAVLCAYVQCVPLRLLRILSFSCFSISFSMLCGALRR